MAMFEQMRANVGKLLKGIDRSEPRRRERFWPAWRRGSARGGQHPGLAQGWDFSVSLEQLFKKTALYRPKGKRWPCLPLSPL